MSSLPALVRAAATRLADAGVPSPRHDAEALAGHVVGVGRSRLATYGELSSRQVGAYHDLVARRANREPLQHLTGRVGFRHLDLEVGPGVFIPRPETEVVVEWCLQALPPGGTAVDLCAGSGAIGLALATERPDSTAHAVEKDPAACRWLARNAAAHAPNTVLRCWEMDIADLPMNAPELLGAVDLVVSNPPYIPLGSSPLEPEVARYDPAIALWAGRDGLDLVRTVAEVARRLLVPGGRLAIEHGDTQGGSVTALLEGAGGWTAAVDHRDLAGRDRFATAVWQG